MARIVLNLYKMFEKDGVGFYKVCDSPIDKKFYIGINQVKQVLEIYLAEDFTNPYKIIDPTKNCSLKHIAGIDIHLLMRILTKATETLTLDYYPPKIS